MSNVVPLKVVPEAETNEVTLTIRARGDMTAIFVHKEAEETMPQRLEEIFDLVRRGMIYIYDTHAEVMRGDEDGKTAVLFILGDDGAYNISSSSRAPWTWKARLWALTRYAKALWRLETDT